MGRTRNNVGVSVGAREHSRARAAGTATLAALCLLVAIAVASPASADAVPGDDRFHGVGIQQFLEYGDDDVSLFREAGVDSVRVLFNWPAIEPERGKYDFSKLDRQIRLTSEAGADVMPFVYGSPPWLEEEFRRPPLRNRKAKRAWGKLLRKLVNRYGRGGSFVKQNEGVIPVKFWQVWNEPNLYGFWRPKPKPAAYGKLLKLSARSIYGADRRAKIVLAGLPPSPRGIDPDDFLRRLVKSRKVRKSFDVAAVHPYGRNVPEMIKRVKLLRRVLNRAKMKRRPLMVTEVGWAPGGANYTLQEQGQLVNTLYRKLSSQSGKLKLSRVYWFAWRDRTDAHQACGFCAGTGLVTENFETKPAYDAFRFQATGP